MTLRIGKPLGASIWRWSAETMPVVTVRENPNGLPIAIAASPTRTLEESPNGSGTSLASLGSTLRTARSFETSRPATSASTKSLSSPKRTCTSCEPSTTWALVTIVPSLSTTKPEPVAVPPGSWGSPNGDSSLELTPRARMKTTPRPSSL